MKKQNTKRKILLVKWGGFNNWGGVVILLLNLLRHMDRNMFDIDFYVFGKITSDSIHRAFSDLGVRVIAGNHDSYEPKAVMKELDELIKRNRYDVVHCNTGSLSLTAVAMFVAWRHRVPVRIAHSHNTKPDAGKYARREYIFQWMNRRLSTVCLACSNKAAEHLFGTAGAKRSSVLKNGIEPETYLFRSDIRAQKRQELKLEDAFVVGHVGRFERQKNHAFLICVFDEIKKKRSDAKLVLLGSGSLINDVKTQVEQLGLSDSVLFIGDSDCVPDYLQAMDVFLFPSLFEGLGIVAIEAQTADLPVVCADTVPAEVAFTPRCIFMPLKKLAAEWSERILEISDTSRSRINRLSDIRTAGYDIAQSAEQLYRVYIQ